MIQLPMFIMRHGKTLWNMEGKLQGRLNSPLLSDSLIIAKKIATFLCVNYKIEKVYCSPLLRCVETAHVVSRILETSFTECNLLMECNMGLCEGMSWLTVSNQFPDFFNKREEDKWRTAWPEGESYLDVFVRANTFLSEAPSDKCILVIGHEMINKCLVGSLLGWTQDQIMKVKQSNQELFIIQHDNMNLIRFCFDFI